jgi:hypothetical protein
MKEYYILIYLPSSKVMLTLEAVNLCNALHSATQEINIDPELFHKVVISDDKEAIFDSI